MTDAFLIISSLSGKFNVVTKIMARPQISLREIRKGTEDTRNKTPPMENALNFLINLWSFIFE
jgi:hypothetical protein